VRAGFSTKLLGFLATRDKRAIRRCLGSAHLDLRSSVQDSGDRAGASSTRFLTDRLRMGAMPSADATVVGIYSLSLSGARSINQTPVAEVVDEIGCDL
jgi:hypothetical protein